MKKLLILLCLLLPMQAFAADTDEIRDHFPITDEKQALLEALYEADIASIREAIDLGLITCRELTEYYLERIEAYEDTFHCFITLCDNALEEADKRDAAIANGSAEGLLFGIPIVVKDNIDYEGYPTTNGYWCYKSAPSESATVVQNLLDEGAVILGKTNMSAGAQDAICSVSDLGIETFNAYNPELASGGSSGGSASAVSLNLAVAGLGTDTNVSLRYPSALNGCVSMRPTVGLLDRDGCVILNYSRDTPGAITRTVKDQAIMLDVMTGGETSYAENLDASALEGMRIGVLWELSYPIANSYDRKESDLDEEILTAFENTVSEFIACGADIEVISIPEVFNYSASDGGGTYLREQVNTKLEAVFEENEISALIFPSYLHTPDYNVTEHSTPAGGYAYICNCAKLSPIAGVPEITIPIGVHSRGAGIGMEILSLKNSEQLLLDIAYSYSEQYNHRQAPETAPSLYDSNQEETLSAYIARYQQEQTRAQALTVMATANLDTKHQNDAAEFYVSEDTAFDFASIPATNESSGKPAFTLWVILPLLAIGTHAAFLLHRRRRHGNLTK